MIRFYNGKVLKADADMSISCDEVWVDGGKICYIGEKKSETPAFEREIDLHGDLLMPGFKNAHTHTAMVFARSLADDTPLQPWLYEQIFPLEAKMNPERIYAMTKLGIMEYLTSGITASFDMYMYNDAYAGANIDCGFRTVICSSMNDFDRDPENIEREFLKFNRLDPLVSYTLGIHAEYTTGRDRLEYMAGLVQKYRSPFFAHNSETKAEYDGCVERHGVSPTELFDSMGMFDYGGGGYHCVWLSDKDMEIFRRRGLYAVTCPGSNSKLASGTAQLTKMQKTGIKLAIGTDGASSNNALDMFREMYLACVLQKLQTGDAAACDADMILRAACSGGAGAMGLSDCDCIAVGKNADLVVIDLSRPNMQPENNITKNLVYSGSKENVRLTMVGGRVLYEKGEFFIGEEPEKICESCRSMVRQLLAE